MDSFTQVYNALISIQYKHMDFFLQEQTFLLDYVSIDWNCPANLTYDARLTLPREIKNDLEQILR